MYKRVAIVGPDTTFNTAVKKDLSCFQAEISLFEFEHGYDAITYCLNNKELPNILFVQMLLYKIDGIETIDYFQTYFAEIRMVCVVEELDHRILNDIYDLGDVGIMSKTDTTMVLNIIRSDIERMTLNDTASMKITYRDDYITHREAIFKLLKITKRERLFLFFNATGLEYTEIATLMFISRKTVDNLFRSVAKKMGVQDRHNLTLLCIRMRLAKFLTVTSAKTKIA